MDKILYTIAQCCEIAAIGRTKFYELIANGEIPARKIGRKTLVAAADLQAWAERLPVLGCQVALPDRHKEALQGLPREQLQRHGRSRPTPSQTTADNEAPAPKARRKG
jgi:excisionase family DNA binding protein